MKLTIYGFKTEEKAAKYTKKNHYSGDFNIKETERGNFKLVKNVYST